MEGKTLLKYLTVLILMMGCYYLGIKNNESRYFAEESASYLGNYKLDLPEEISQVGDIKDTTVDLLLAFLDPKDQTISLRFSGHQMSDNQLLINNRYAKSPLLHYQLYLDSTFIALYDRERLIGKMPYDSSELNKLINKDNE